MQVSDRQATAYLTAVASRSMAERAVDAIDEVALTAILEDRDTTEAQKAAAIQHLMGSQ